MTQQLDIFAALAVLLLVLCHSCISGSYGTVVVKFEKWRRKLVEPAVPLGRTIYIMIIVNWFKHIPLVH